MADETTTTEDYTEDTTEETTEETSEESTDETSEETTEETTEEEDPTIEEEIIALAQTYFQMMDTDVTEAMLTVMVNTLIDGYKNKRNYPDSYTTEMIEADVDAYFGRRKSEAAFVLIPKIYGRMGGEGLSMLTDAGTTRMWVKAEVLDDVTPICEVV